MATNTTLTADIVLKEAHRILRNNTPFINSLKPQYDQSYAAHGAKEGSDIRIRVPMKYKVRSGKNIEVQENIEQAVTLSRSVQTGIDLGFSSAELTQDIERLSELYIAPAVATLAADLEYKALTAAYQQTANGVTLPTSALDKADILEAGVRLDYFSTPRDGKRRVVLDPKGQADIVTDLATLFNDPTKISAQYRDGTMGSALGFTFAMSQGVNSLLTGTRANYATNQTISAQGETDIDVTTGTGTFKLGETFTIADVYSVNPLTKQSTGKLMQFRVTEALGSGNATNIKFAPAIYSTGPLQNVNSLPQTAKAVTFLGTAATAYPQNIAYHPRAFAFATVDMDMPPVQFKARKMEDGISMRLVGQYDVKTDDTYYRLDLLHGIVAVEPDFACKIYGV